MELKKVSVKFVMMRIYFYISLDNVIIFFAFNVYKN